jgi:hypothetical protein
MIASGSASRPSAERARRSRRVVRQVITLTGAVGLLAGSLLAAPASAVPGRERPASAAGTPGWRVVKTLGPSQLEWSAALVATSPSDAWSEWIGSTPKSNLSYIEHWNGKSWQPVRFPSSVAGYIGSFFIGASSASDVWLFNNPGQVARWNGHKWYLQAIPGWVVHGNLSGDTALTPVIFSPRDVWVFSLGADDLTHPDHYAARYNGRTWSKAQLPGVPENADAVSPNDIWLLCSTGWTAFDSLLIHWNGKKWSTVTLPKVSAPKGSTGSIDDIAAISSNDVWLQANVANAAGTNITKYFLHGNGRTWTRVDFPYPDTDEIGMAQDGHGGLWMIGSENTTEGLSYFYHFNDGHWTRYPLPAAAIFMWPGPEWIPGTRSLWSAVNVNRPSGSYGEILKYGP